MIVFIFFLVAARTPAIGQLSSTDILSNHIGKMSDKVYNKNISYFESNNMELSTVNKIGFRTETEEMDVDQQKYMVRVNFNSSAIKNAYKKLMTATKNEYKSLQSQNELRKTTDIYNLIVKWQIAQKEKSIINEGLLIQTDIQNVLNKMLINGMKFNMNEWLNNENNISDGKSDSISILLEIKNLENLLKINDNQNNIANWISISKINEIVNTIDESTIAQTIMNNVAIDKAKAELELEKAEGKKWFDFAQVQYQQENKLNFQKEFSFGASISIPYKARNKTKINEATLELYEQDYKSQIRQTNKESIINNLKTKIRNLTKQLTHYTETLNKMGLQKTYNSVLNNASVSPLELLNIKALILKQKKKTNKIKRDIFFRYIEFLKETELLLSSKVNYLSNNLETY